MKQIKFPYLKYIVTPPTQKPPQYIYRPVIPVKLFLDKKAVTFDALVDSGADECTFPADAYIARRNSLWFSRQYGTYSAYYNS